MSRAPGRVCHRPRQWFPCGPLARRIDGPGQRHQEVLLGARVRRLPVSACPSPPGRRPTYAERNVRGERYNHTGECVVLVLALDALVRSPNCHGVLRGTYRLPHILEPSNNKPPLRLKPGLYHDPRNKGCAILGDHREVD